MDENKRKVPKIRFPGFTDDWEQRKLGEILKYEQPTNYIVKDTDYNDDFGIPVLTAGQSFILGYTHEKNGIKNADKNNPVIIFDDFTTSSHYVDFPFKVKSSAMKLLTLNQKNDDFYFMYNVLKNLNYNPQGHERHWISKFSEFKVFIPNKLEQEKIGTFLKELDHLITLQQRKLDHLKEQKKGLLQKMFPKKGEKVPEIRFPGFTDDWEMRKLGELGNTYSGLSGKTKGDFGHGKAQFVTYMNVFSNPIAKKEMVEPIEIDETQHKVLYGDVLFTTSSETPEEVGMSSVWLENTCNTYLNSFCFGYRPTSKIDSHFIAYVLRSDSIRKKIIFLAQGISRYNISKNKMMEIQIPIPKLSEQVKLGKYFTKFDNLITLHQRKLDHLKEQKKGLLQQMFV